MEKINFYILLLLGCLIPVVLGGCSAEHDAPETPANGARVCFAVGGSTTSPTRAAFKADTPMKVYVFQRANAHDAADFSGLPFKTAEGRSSGSGSGTLSDITLTSGDLEEDGTLLVPAGYTYDFVVVVNASSGATASSLGSLNTGYLTGFSHGSDILAGRKEGVEVKEGQTKVDIMFTEYGADTEGNLPHLCSAVVVEARTTQALIDHLNGTLDYAVGGMDFKQCLPKSANLPFAGDPMAMTIQGSGYTTSYSPAITGSTVTVTQPADVAVSKDGVILPYPLKTQGQDYNVVTIDFHLRVNGGDVTLTANGVRVPAFEPGYRYRFITELDHDAQVEQGKINLYLSVESWSSVNWNSGMGEGETHSWMYIELGSWNSISWQAVMGEGQLSNKIITGVWGWLNATWTSDMGKKD